MLRFVNKELERRVRLMTVLLFTLMIVLALYFFVWVRTLREIQGIAQETQSSRLQYQEQLNELISQRE